MTRSQPGRNGALAVALAALALAWGPAAVADQDVPVDESLLAEQRWEEPAFGLSLRPPQGAKPLQSAGEDALVGFLLPDTARISLRLVESDEPIDLEAVKTKAFEQFQFAYPSSVQIDPQVWLPPRLSAAKMFLAARDKQSDTFWFGQTYILLNNRTMLIAQLDAPQEVGRQAVATLSAIIWSIEFRGPEGLQKEREQQLQIGDAWLDGIDNEALTEAWPRELWFRIVRGGEDVGYQRVNLITDADALRADALDPGFAVKVQSRIVGESGVLDSREVYYLSADRASELWDVKRTLRRGEGVRGAQASTWVETGVRGPQTHNGKQINLLTVQTDIPAELGVAGAARAETTDQTVQWPTPELAYLPQAMYHALTPMWSRLPADKVAFYAYDSGSRSLSLRLAQAENTDAGGRRVAVKHSPQSAEHVFTYDPTGRLLKAELPDGTAFVPADADELRRIWRIK